MQLFRFLHWEQRIQQLLHNYTLVFNCLALSLISATVCTGRFVSHLHTGAEVSLSVVKILCLVCQSVNVQRHLVNLLTANQVRE